MKKLHLVLLVSIGSAFTITFWVTFSNNSFSKENSKEKQLTKFVTAPRTKTENCKVQGPLPDSGCTPGAIFENVTAQDICTPGYSKKARNVSTKTKNQVYEEYGITKHEKGEYEVDHFISLELGGSNDIANLFPEAAEPRPGFHEKDKIENYLHAEVCAGRMTLAEAQKNVSWEWVKTYEDMQPTDPLKELQKLIENFIKN